MAHPNGDSFPPASALLKESALPIAPAHFAGLPDSEGSPARSVPRVERIGRREDETKKRPRTLRCAAFLVDANGLEPLTSCV